MSRESDAYFGKSSPKEALADAVAEEWQRRLDEQRNRADALEAHLEAAKGIMYRLIETPRYMAGPRPPAVQEYLDWIAAIPRSVAHD